MSTPTVLNALTASPAQSASLVVVLLTVIGWLRWGLKAPTSLLLSVMTWALLVGGLALTGYFSQFDLTWRALSAILISFLAALWWSSRSLTTAGSGQFAHGFEDSGWLSRAPAWAWVALQTFRLPVELLLHSLYSSGVIGMRLTFEGQNLDILVGLTAPLMAGLMAWQSRSVLRYRQSRSLRQNRLRKLVIVWNLIGLALLINVAAVAMLSAPLPFQVFTEEPVNRVVAQWPFIWLPTLLVPLALMGHVVSIRRALCPAAHKP